LQTLSKTFWDLFSS
jgi:hypothetical protein